MIAAATPGEKAPATPRRDGLGERATR